MRLEKEQVQAAHAAQAPLQPPHLQPQPRSQRSKRRRSSTRRLQPQPDPQPTYVYHVNNRNLQNERVTRVQVNGSLPNSFDAGAAYMNNGYAHEPVMTYDEYPAASAKTPQPDTISLYSVHYRF